MVESGAPPSPPLHLSPTTASTTPAAFRSARQDELEALRSKGLAKIFNRHFTGTTERINAEREAAEVALNEIVARKAKLAANPKSFDKGGLTLTQLDALQMELKKRKQSVQRKERETVELYRRYVAQYGGNEQAARKALGGNAMISNSITSMKNTMPVLHENRDYDIIRQTDLETARAKEKKKCVGVGSSTAPKFEDGSFNESKKVPYSPNNRVGKLKKSDGPIQPPQLPTLDMDSPGVVASSGSSTSNQPQDKPSTTTNDISDARPASPSNSYGNVSGLDSTFMGGIMVGPGNDDDCDTDEDSAMSGLTSIDAATVAMAEYKLTEFLREETENIRKMLCGEEEESSEYDDELSDLGTMTTSTSLDSQRAINAAKKAEDLAKEMEQQTAWMNNPSLLEDSDEDDGEKSIPSKPQWVAYYSEEQKRVYYSNTETNESRWTEPRGVEIDKTALEKLNLPKDDSCDDDEDMVVVKDYTKADPTDAQPQHRSMSDNLAQIDRFRPDSDGLSIGSGDMSRTSRASKVLAYKRKRRLQRRRRNRVIVAFTVCGMFGIGAYKSREQWMPILGLQTARQKAIEEERILKEKAALEAEQERKETMRKEEEKRKLEEKERKKAELEAKKKAERERKEAERIAREEAEQKRIEAKLAAKREAEEKRIAAELAAKKQAEEKRIEAELAAKKKAEEERIKAEIAAQKKAEEARIKAEIAAQKKAEEARIKAEIAAQKKAEEERIKAAEKKAEEDRIKAEKEAKRNAEIAAAKKKAEEERIAAELLAKKKAEQERIEAAKKAEEEAAKKAEEERLKAEKKAEEEKLRLAKVKAEEEKRRQEAEALKEKELREQELEKGLKAIPEKAKKNLCNIPFSVYFVKRCKVKSRKKPSFDLKGLVETMME